MANRLDGKVAFITGAGRGQGRAHAVQMASEGADIICVDICEQVESNNYPLATQEDLEATSKVVENLGRRCIAIKADVRERDQLRKVVDEGIRELSRLASDESRYITGQQIRVDAGALLKAPNGPAG